MFSERVKGREYSYSIDLQIDYALEGTPTYFDTIIYNEEHFSKLEKSQGIEIPVEILKGQNSGLRAIVKYLKEKGLTFSEISRILNRDPRTIWSSYNSSKPGKSPKITRPELSINSSEFKNRKLSVLETIASSLAQKGLSLKQMSSILGKSPKTIWTVKHRAEQKMRKTRKR